MPNSAADSLERPGPLWNGWSKAPFRAFKGISWLRATRLFAGSIPKFYDTLMVPLIFEAYAANMAELVAAFSPGAVLETAAGSGAVTRALAPKLKPDAHYVVTDLNQPMLDYATTRQGFDGRIEWRQADALTLPFEDASFDVVCCQFGAMFFPNRVAGYAEASPTPSPQYFRTVRRVLRPGGRFVFSVWDRIEENAFADDHEEVSRSPSARDAATAYCQGTPLRNEIEARDASLLQIATDRASQAIASRHGEGPVAGKIQAHVIVAAG